MKIHDGCMHVVPINYSGPSDKGQGKPGLYTPGVVPSLGIHCVASDQWWRWYSVHPLSGQYLVLEFILLFVIAL